MMLKRFGDWLDSTSPGMWVASACAFAFVLLVIILSLIFLLVA